MDFTPLRMGWRTIASSWRHFGLRQTLMQFGLLGIAATSRASMALDYVFAPGWRKQKVVRPTFIIGAPRSGTTFFHRLLTQTDEFPHWLTWELICPSITARRLFRPLVPLVVKAVGAGFEDDSTLFEGDGHETSPTSIEEEEVLFLLRMDTQFVNLFMPIAFDEDDAPDIVWCDRQDADRRKASMQFLDACFRRQIHLTGRQHVLAKMPYSTLRVRSLLEQYPDARFIYLVRSPFETMRSHMTLHRGFFSQRYGLDNIPAEVQARYWDRRFRYNAALYRYFEDLMDEGALSEEQVLTVRFPDIVENLDEVYAKVKAFTGFPYSAELDRLVAEQAARQGSYKAKHSNLTLDEFGIDRQRVIDELGFVFDRYDFPTE